MKVRVNATRIELLKLKKRLKVAQRGHKLLKEKRDGLMKDFMAVIREARAARQAVEEALSVGFQSAAFAASEMSSQALEQALMLPKAKVELTVSKKNIMNVKVPVFGLQKEGDPICYGYLDTAAELDAGIIKLDASLEKMVNLAQIEKAILMLSREIEKTRRRVNSLEYVLIPDLEDSIREITMKLDEQERGNLTRLMKVKDIIAVQ